MDQIHHFLINLIEKWLALVFGVGFPFLFNPTPLPEFS
jgi:hypothetical protein